MATIDRVGNKHRSAGAPDGGQFAGKLNSAPTAGLNEQTEEAGWEWERPSYRIPTGNLGILQERIDKANKRLQRAGIDERFTFTAERRIVRDERTGQEHTTNEVTLNTPRISAGDWRFDGVHELGANGRVISHFTHGAEAILDESKDLLVCEHCGHRRSRTKVMVVTNPSTGETKQVGTNCLGLFLGVKPQGLWALDENFGADDLEVDDDDLGTFRNPSAGIIDADDVLAVTLQVIAEDGGYLSKAKAIYTETPTADKVLERIGARSAMRPQLTDTEQAEVAAVLAYVDQIDPSEAGEYERNLHQALAADGDGQRRIDRKHVALVASAIPSFRSHQAFELKKKLREEARAKQDTSKAQAYLAAPGESLKGRDIEATILSVRLGQDYGYGAPLHVSMMDDDGHVIYWKCSGILGGSIETKDGQFVQWAPDDGSRVVIAGGTVKDNRVSDYNGDWETVITRAKLVPPAEVIAGWDAEPAKP
ncbi:hypothetical protein [Microbacterium gorillae]|uniref:hypothetical protein n=1 Tax=Microbacterium gorillae TaxID=1231063 RepID=UPI003D99C5DD